MLINYKYVKLQQLISTSATSWWANRRSSSQQSFIYSCSVTSSITYIIIGRCLGCCAFNMRVFNNKRGMHYTGPNNLSLPLRRAPESLTVSGPHSTTQRPTSADGKWCTCLVGVYLICLKVFLIVIIDKSCWSFNKNRVLIRTSFIFDCSIQLSENCSSSAMELRTEVQHNIICSAYHTIFNAIHYFGLYLSFGAYQTFSDLQQGSFWFYPSTAKMGDGGFIEYPFIFSS